MTTEQPTVAQNENMQRYYKIHAAIYDMTRWSFLLGRAALLNRLPFNTNTRKVRFLWEVGCGTGHNLNWLARNYPEVQIEGVDVSEDMLSIARKGLSKTKNGAKLHLGSYEQNGVRPATPPDVVLFSYALTMFNPGWQFAIQCAKEDLAPGGRIAIVDFHNSPVGWFKRWMRFNHVKMDGHLLPFLQKHFTPEHMEVKKAYFGLWEYVIFVGIK
jgi:S-adenosylmethionine-diacylgycerolhomoserine-N-methlytransferase